MKTQSINSAEKNNTNVIIAGAGGAAAAAVATRFIPLTKSEHDEAFKAAAGEISRNIRALKDEKFKVILDEISNNSRFDNVTDVFVKNKEAIINNTQEQIEAATKTLDDNSKNLFNSLVTQLTDYGKSAENVLNNAVIKQAKKHRPIVYFAALAGAISMTGAVLKNVLTAKKTQEQTVGISYDKEGMIIDAPDSLSLAIILDEYA